MLSSQGGLWSDGADFLEMLSSILECPMEPWWLPFLVVGPLVK